MKKICSIVIILSLAILFAMPVMAAPAAEMTVTLSDVYEDENGWLFTLNIEMLAPSEPYASMDFKLVSGDYEQLAIVDNSTAGDRSDLDIKFTKDYGSAYHKGRIDSATGAISHLIGIFTQTSGNGITDQIEVCAVTMRYTGSEPIDLSLEGLQLVYKDASGKITSNKGFEAVSFTIDPDFLADAATVIEDVDDPLASFADENPNFLLIAVITLGALCAVVVAVLVLRKRKQKLALQGANTTESSVIDS